MEEMEQEPLDFQQIAKKQPDVDPSKELAGLMKKMQIDVVGREQGNKNSDGGMSDDDDDEEDGDNHEDSQEEIQEEEDKNDQQHSNKHTKYTDLEERAAEDMDFPDEVDTPFVDAYKRFGKYRGIKSLKNCDWDPYENLPSEYSKLFRFQQY